MPGVTNKPIVLNVVAPCRDPSNGGFVCDASFLSLLIGNHHRLNEADMFQVYFNIDLFKTQNTYMNE